MHGRRTGCRLTRAEAPDDACIRRCAAASHYSASGCAGSTRRLSRLQTPVVGSSGVCDSTGAAAIVTTGRGCIVSHIGWILTAASFVDQPTP